MPKSVTELPEAQVTPLPELEKRTRRTFTAEYKRRILAEADACEHGELSTYRAHYPCPNTSGVWGQSPQEEFRGARPTPLAPRFAFSNRGGPPLQNIHYL